jgi:hypothetical protein
MLDSVERFRCAIAKTFRSFEKVFVQQISTIVMKPSKGKIPSFKPFEKWNIDQLFVEFGLQRVQKLPCLDEWIKTALSRTTSDVANKSYVLELQEFLRENIDYWNEEELKFKFIGPLISTIRLDSDKYSSFLDRKLSAELNGKKISGVVDFIVATGKVEPREPFFFLHEYKKERGGDNDPLGQLIIAMYAAQTLNSTTYLGQSHPMYGCYVVGRNWFFVVLDGLEYATSDAFVSTQDDIFQIIAIVQEAKTYIEEILAKRRVS